MSGYTVKVWLTESYPLFCQQEDGSYCPEPYVTTDYDVFNYLEVPNGTWVMERPCFGHTELVGTDHDQLWTESLDKRPGRRRSLYLSEQTFGFVQAEKTGYDPVTNRRTPQGSRRLYYARQVHKGELGRGISIPRLQFAREHPDNARKMHDFERNRDQRRNPFRWARLSDLVAAAGISPHTAMADYWPFIGWSYDHVGRRHGELLHVRYGTTPDDIGGQSYGPSHLTFEELGREIMGGRALDEIWIRAGLANTILRLQALNYQPVATSTA